MNRLDRIKEIVRLARQYQTESSSLRVKHQIGDLGLDWGEPSHISYVTEALKLSDPLKRYLDLLDEAELSRLETIMYFGRDPEDVHGNDLADFRRMLAKNSARKKDMVRNMAEKVMALEVYFSQAIAKSKKLDLDLDASF